MDILEQMLESAMELNKMQGEQLEWLQQKVAVLESQLTGNVTKKPKRKNTIGLNIIDGGRKLEPGHGPFAPQNPS